MATCKDCVHYDVCRLPYRRNTIKCKTFKNNADFVEVKHGHWEKRSFIVFDNEIENGYRCTECNTTWDTETNYCPYCGADMRKE